MIDPKLLSLLRCPVEGGPLKVADHEIVQRVQQAIKSGSARDRLDQRVEQNIEGGLVNQSASWLYPIRSRIPTLVADEAIRLQGVE